MGLFSFFRKRKKEEGKLQPESKWKVEFKGSTITTTDYDGNEHSIALRVIHQIIIETNDSGPWGTDIWWRILSDDGILSVPGGATGEMEMLKNFQRFPNFDNEQLINAMGSTENAEFVVWKNE
ncbi:hypothetical protein [Flagellimonas myxillae]|uniref:hypothetical protein n=1 Tax=Flagellimonas myxillae TaxID=2942214 RepID=UPI00201F2069|nr:hypothetical protein [Muricauda myxillae]MCL6267188.1 hypothetical protein [Muricauda myxillae]